MEAGTVVMVKLGEVAVGVVALEVGGDFPAVAAVDLHRREAEVVALVVGEAMTDVASGNSRGRAAAIAVE